MSKLPIYKYLDISTAHISEKINDILSKNINNGLYPLIILDTEHGYFINVPYNLDELEREFPGDLISCLGLAQKHGCRWLMLDCDAEVVDELEQFYW